ncbi:MAG: site-specific DNA-methyltransferase [Nitrososphaera sp.]|uniref:DNA-methyltransferase n=1 Tax=Nitrososphaera sp. TaxID=1971748 RepID=UPI0017F47B1F|nr:site-specific DNA-methyltransferase [Nitrososphaera sp.]NWG37208.1 site-specific DNA-methyltransferase [Nitrososphaera sp.]
MLAQEEQMADRVILGNCKSVLQRLPENSVQLTITSPPYRNAINYDMHASGNGGYYRGNAGVETAEYLDEMTEIFGEKVYRVTKDGGYCCIVIANEVVNGTILPLPHMLLSRLVQPFGRWQMHEEIIWHKVTGGTNRYGSFVINPYPKYYRANIMHEFILVLRKGDVASGRKRKEALPATHEEWTKEIANSVWHIAPVPPGYIDHPCPYPEEIPYRLMQVYSYKGDVVLDPFNGSGQTTKVAHNIGRRYIGIDMVKEYVELARSRIAGEALHIREETLIASWKKIRSHYRRR